MGAAGARSTSSAQRAARLNRASDARGAHRPRFAERRAFSAGLGVSASDNSDDGSRAQKPCRRGARKTGRGQTCILILTCFKIRTDYCDRGRVCNRSAVACPTLRSESESLISAFYLFWESISETTEANNASDRVFAEESAFRLPSSRLHS